jgi:hypothetical protein
LTRRTARSGASRGRVFLLGSDQRLGDPQTGTKDQSIGAFDSVALILREVAAPQANHVETQDAGTVAVGQREGRHVLGTPVTPATMA